MQKHHIDPAQANGSDPVSREQAEPKASTRRTTSIRLVVGALALLVLAIPVIGLLVSGQPSYAQPNIHLLLTVDCATTPDPSCTPTPTPTNTPTPTPTATNTPTPVPTATKTPTPRPKPSPTATVVPSPSATADASPTASATAAAVAGGGTPGVTPTSGPASTGGNGGGSAFPLGTALMVLFVLFGVVLSLGVGWLLFRRMLMPTNEVKLKPSGARPWARTRVSNTAAGQANAGMMNNMNMAAGFGPGPNGFEQPNNEFAVSQLAFDPTQPGFGQNPGFDPTMQGFDPMMNNGYAQQGFDPMLSSGFGQPAPGFDPMQQNGFGPNMYGSGPMNNGFDPMLNNKYAQQAPQGMNGYGQVPGGFGTPASGFGGFSDSFVPPSPRVFPQGDASVGLHNTGSFPSVGPGQGHGYAPASNAFNAMYGLPNDPFASSQGGSPGWVDSLGGAQGQGFGAQPPQTPNNVVPGAPDVNDPYLAEVIRQYRQQGQPGPLPQLPQPENERRSNNGPDSLWLQ